MGTADLLALVCGVLLRVCHFPIGILGQVWYLIVSIPGLCILTYFFIFRFLVYFLFLYCKLNSMDCLQFDYIPSHRTANAYILKWETRCTDPVNKSFTTNASGMYCPASQE